jgi:membrane protease YdiL (CAAX protease family)
VAAILTVFMVWAPSLERFASEGSAQRPFVGLGFSTTAIALAFLHGVVQTGFTEELLFRGLIAGSLSRRLSLLWANLLQALIFLLPRSLAPQRRPRRAAAEHHQVARTQLDADSWHRT